MSELFFTAEEVAEKLRVNKVTVHRWIRSGRLRAANLGGTSGYRIRGADVEAHLWTEYHGVGGPLRRAAHAVYEASEALSSYADRFDDTESRRRAQGLRVEADQMFREAERFLDLQGFYRPPSSPRTLRELQPFMATPHIYDSGNADFQVVAIMVRDAIAGDSRTASNQGVRNAIAKAEASNPPDSEHGRLVRIAGALLLANVGEPKSTEPSLPE